MFRLNLLDAAVAAAVAALVRGGQRSNPSPIFEDNGRGRDASGPAQIPWRGWREVLGRTVAEFNTDHISLISGGVTFSVLLAIFPALAAFVALYGLVGDVQSIPAELRFLSILLPPDLLGYVGGEMIRLARADSGGLSLTLFVGLAISFWSANGAMGALMVGLNVAYEESEARGFVKATLISLGFTIGLFAFVGAAIVGLSADAVAAPLLGPGAAFAIAILRWPVLVIAFAGGLSLLYRFGPSREHARWRWISVGGAAATAAWLLTSLIFSYYVGRFAHFDRTYGSLATVIALMMWIWLSVMIVLAGAELNAELEHQTAVDPATGAPRPWGAIKAYRTRGRWTLGRLMRQLS
jgi:membrane protein